MVLEDFVFNAAEGVVDLAALGETVPGGGGDVNALAVLDEELLDSTALELGNNAVIFIC